MQKLKIFSAFLLIFTISLLITGCSGSSKEPTSISTPEPTETSVPAAPIESEPQFDVSVQEPTVAPTPRHTPTLTSASSSLPVIAGTVDEKIHAIAETITMQSDGLLTVPYVEAVPHQRESGETHYGVHYNVFVVKRSDHTTVSDETRVRALVGELFRLTTKHVLAVEPEFSHMGAQVFDADTWFYRGHERGSVRIFIASKESLLRRARSPLLGRWLDVAQESPETVIFSSALQSLINQLQAAERLNNAQAQDDSTESEPTAKVDAVPDGAGTQAPDGATVTVTLKNEGGSMEGHTPRGFEGMGTGLFVGDNLNPNFPDNDGVQIFLNFDLSTLPAGEIVSAVLRSKHGHVEGSPFIDLGALKAEEIRYASFSSSLWNLKPEGTSCVFGTSFAGLLECDLTDAVQRSLNDGYQYAQFRLRFDKASDADGEPDLIMFFITNSNTNEPGIFELEVTIIPKAESP